jgi:hypothetical protein
MAVLFIVLRLLSLILIVLALMMLGADVFATLEKGGTITVHSVEQIWALISAGGLASFKSWIAASVPAPFSNWLYGVLGMWAFGVTGVPGVILAFLFGRRTADVD